MFKWRGLLGIRCCVPSKSYWVLLTQHILADSRRKDYESQQAMVRDIPGPDYDLPFALEVATGILSHYARTQECLLSDSPATYTCCALAQLSPYKKPLFVGDFIPAGIYVGSDIYDDVRRGSGVVCSRRF